MPVWRFMLGLAIGFFCLASSAAAIVIMENRGAAIGGFLVNDDGREMTIRVRGPDGQEKVSKYAHARFTVLHRLDVKRLEGLSRDNPQAYRDYAEELARQPADPEARYMALRLYLIAAKLDPQKYGPSSLLGMSALADTPADVRKYRALAFILDPKADARLLQAEAGNPAPRTPAQVAALRDFVKALQSYRAGQIKVASDTVKRDGVDKVFSAAPGQIDQKTFLQWCTDANCTACKMTGRMLCTACKGSGATLGMFGQREACKACKGQKIVPCSACEGSRVNQPYSDDVMRLVLRAELWAMDQLAGDDAGKKEASEAKNWSSVLQSRQLKPVLPLSLETISELDPNKCHYRNGVWVAP